MASDDIKQLSDREHCRSRVGMYLGGISEDGSDNPESLRTAIREAVDNSKDELLKGNGTTIWMFNEYCDSPIEGNSIEGKVIPENTKWVRYTVADNAGGIPIKKMTDLNGKVKTMTEVAVGNFRAGSKFSKDTALVGLNGVGISAGNFTSAVFTIYSHLKCHNLSDTTDEVIKLIKDNKITSKNSEGWYYKLTFNIGLKVEETIVRYDDEEFLVNHFYDAGEYPSTITTFIPDPTIHGSCIADLPTDFQYLGYLYPQFSFYCNHQKLDTKIGYDFADSVTVMNPRLGTGYFGDNDENCKNPWIKFDFSIRLSEDMFNYQRQFSVNTLECQQGRHVKLWDDCFTAAFCNYFKNWDIYKYATYGVDVLMILQCPEPAFSSQTKERCSAIEGWKYDVEYFDDLIKAITKIIKKNEEYFTKQYERIVAYHNSTIHLGKMKELQKTLGNIVKGNNKSMSALMPYKLVACTDQNAPNKSVYFVEGNSAGSSLVKGRKGINNVAILPLRGKVANVVGKDVNVVLENQEISDITYVCGGVDDLHLDLDKLPFERYVIATDEDSDGKQIASLLLGVLLQNHKFMFGTPENEYKDSKVFIAKAALYGFFDVDGQKGNNQLFFAGEEAKVAEFQKNHKFKSAKRWKGLGECNPDEIASMYFDESTAKLLQVTPENVDKALYLIGTKEWKHDLMIEKSVITDDTLDLSNPSIIATI